MPAITPERPVEEHPAIKMVLECRPNPVHVARYTTLPYPNLGPAQEFGFDLGLSANAPMTLVGMIWQVWSGHQIVAERRRNFDTLKTQIGTDNLRIEPGEGLVIPRNYFFEMGMDDLTRLTVFAVGRPDQGSDFQQQFQIELTYHTQQVDLRLPFQGIWWAVIGNDWTDAHKAEPVSQAFAYDFVKLGDQGRPFTGTGLRNQEHFSFAAPVVAPAAAIVVTAIAGVPDNEPGEYPAANDLNELRNITGNLLVLDHGTGEFSVLMHLQQGSLLVQMGDLVGRGQVIAAAGNSGYSAGPHLHYHLQAGSNVFLDAGLPVEFSHFAVTGDRVARATLPSRLIVEPLED